MAGVLSRFSFATATIIQQLKNSSSKKKHCKKNCFLVVGSEKVVFRKGIAKEIEIYKPTRLFSSDSTPKLKTNIVKPRKRRFHSIESDSDTD